MFQSMVLKFFLQILITQSTESDINLKRKKIEHHLGQWLEEINKKMRGTSYKIYYNHIH